MAVRGRPAPHKVLKARAVPILRGKRAAVYSLANTWTTEQFHGNALHQNVVA